MDKLTCLSRLSNFIVGVEESCSSNWMKWFVGLEELMAIKNLRDDLRIMIMWPKEYKNFGKEGRRRRGFYLRDKKHLNHIDIFFDEGHYDSILWDDDEGRQIYQIKFKKIKLNITKQT